MPGLLCTKSAIQASGRAGVTARSCPPDGFSFPRKNAKLISLLIFIFMAKRRTKKVDLKKIAEGVRLMLEGMGEDPDRDGLKKTPERVAEFYAELTEGMWDDPKQHIVPLPGDSHDEMVIVKDISIASVCEHHLAPFVGKCHIAYIPQGGRIVGLSKLARIAESFSRRLQVQERLTQQIAQTLFDNLQPIGVMVVIEAEHTCMTLRGVKKPGAVTITSAVLGGFRKDPRTRAEAMALIKG